MFKIKLLSISVILCGVVFLAGSCTKKAKDDIPTTLEITNKDEIIAGSDGGIFEVQVKSNAKQWVAYSDQDWVETVRSGQKLTIKVSPNESGSARSSIVQISNEGGTQRITVKQKGTSTEVTIKDPSMSFGQFGGEKKFYVEATSDKWSVKCEAEWLKVNQRTDQGEVIITSDENKDRADRTSEVEFTDPEGNTINRITVTQKGILYYYLPYMEYGAGEDKIIAFEKERYSKAPEGPSKMGSRTTWTFETVSPIFPIIRYVFNRGKYISAILYTPNRSPENLQGKTRQEIIEYIKERGFEQLGDDNSFFNEEKNVDVKITAIHVNPNITFTFIPPQPQPYPTFEKLPISRSNFYTARKEDLGDEVSILRTVNRGDDEDIIFKGEKENGWTFIPPYDKKDPKNINDNFLVAERKRDEYSQTIKEPLFFGAKKKNEKDFRTFYRQMVFEKDGQYRSYLLDRVYEEYINTFVDKDDPFYGEFYGEKSVRVCGTGLSRSIQTFRDINKFFYLSDGMPYVTKEFKELLHKEGYVYSSYIDRDRSFVYIHPEQNIELTIKIGKTIVDGDNKPLVAIMRLAHRDANAHF